MLATAIVPLLNKLISRLIVQYPTQPAQERQNFFQSIAESDISHAARWLYQLLMRNCLNNEQ